MSATAVRNGLATRLGTISGLRVYATPPALVQELPAGVVTSGDPFLTYDQLVRGADVRYSFRVLLLVDSADEAQAWADLEPYLSATGASSVKAAVDGNLGGSADWARLVRSPSVGRVTCGQGVYWGATFIVEAYESG
ncbi:MAG TPA: hypothetical protein VI855_07435 [Dehalococcoidia bacterium]|nr:hypothetical protein [Dehalococcoidia bacterium]